MSSRSNKSLNKTASKHTYYSYIFPAVMIVLSVAWLTVLLTYSSADGGVFATASTQEIYNAGGVLGAYIADFFIRLMGLTAYLLPILFFWFSIQYLLRQFNSHTVKHASYIANIGRSFIMLGCIIASLVSSTVLLATHWEIAIEVLPGGSGGWLGSGLALPMFNLFGVLITTFITVSVFIIAISYLLSLPWVTIFNRTGIYTEKLYKPILGILFVFDKDRPIYVYSQSQKTTNTPGPILKAAESKNSIRTSKLFVNSNPKPTTNHDDYKGDPPLTQNKPTITTRKITSATYAKNNEEKASSILGSDEKEKRNLKIVPLDETHQQDTGTSVVTESRPLSSSTKVITCPSVAILDSSSISDQPTISQAELEEMSKLLEVKLLDFGVTAEVTEVNPGPVITRFEIQPAPGTKVSKISNLSKDLARSMAVLSVRVVEVIAGKPVIGIEIPNPHRAMVCISEVLGSELYQSSISPLTLGLGNDIGGFPAVVDLSKMPHLLVAGTTGSGKSVGVNAMIISLLLKSTPEQVRLLLVDPKMLELSIYDGIPHLLAPVITDMKEAAGGLRWCVAEMERRYKIMASQGVRNIDGYNNKVNQAQTQGQPILDVNWQANELMGETETDRPSLEPFPFIVVVIDEFADMMMIVGKKVEELIARIAQKARAAGIHLILATQRPSVDVITGLIKANVPTRIAFQVSSKIDSRTILDQGGAESLLGHGDMLYLAAGKSVPERVHGAFVSDDEVHRVVEAWKKIGTPDFVDAIVNGVYDNEGQSTATNSDEKEEMDSLYDEALAFVTETRRASISSVQRKFKIGYNRAARIIEAMEAEGVITSQGHNGSREVLAPPPIKD